MDGSRRARDMQERFPGGLSDMQGWRDKGVGDRKPKRAKSLEELGYDNSEYEKTLALSDAGSPNNLKKKMDAFYGALQRRYEFYRSDRESLGMENKAAELWKLCEQEKENADHDMSAIGRAGGEEPLKQYLGKRIENLGKRKLELDTILWDARRLWHCELNDIVTDLHSGRREAEIMSKINSAKEKFKLLKQYVGYKKFDHIWEHISREGLNDSFIDRKMEWMFNSFSAMNEEESIESRYRSSIDRVLSSIEDDKIHIKRNINVAALLLIRLQKSTEREDRESVGRIENAIQRGAESNLFLAEARNRLENSKQKPVASSQESVERKLINPAQAYKKAERDLQATSGELDALVKAYKEARRVLSDSKEKYMQDLEQNHELLKRTESDIKRAYTTFISRFKGLLQEHATEDPEWERLPSLGNATQDSIAESQQWLIALSANDSLLNPLLPNIIIESSNMQEVLASGNEVLALQKGFSLLQDRYCTSYQKLYEAEDSLLDAMKPLLKVEIRQIDAIQLLVRAKWQIIDSKSNVVQQNSDEQKKLDDERRDCREMMKNLYKKRPGFQSLRVRKESIEIVNEKRHEFYGALHDGIAQELPRIEEYIQIFKVAQRREANAPADIQRLSGATLEDIQRLSEATPEDIQRLRQRIGQRTPEDIQRLSGATPEDIQRLSGATPEDIQLFQDIQLLRNIGFLRGPNIRRLAEELISYGQETDSVMGFRGFRDTWNLLADLAEEAGEILESVSNDIGMLERFESQLSRW